MPVREAQADGELVALLEAELQPECVGDAKADVVSEPEPVRLCDGLALALMEGEDVALMLPVPDGQCEVDGVEDRELEAQLLTLPDVSAEAVWLPDEQGEGERDALEETKALRVTVPQEDKDGVTEGLPVPLPQALRVDVREVLPLTVTVGHCDTERLGDGDGDSVLDTQADTVEEAEAHCDSDSVALLHADIDTLELAEGQ